MQLRTTKGFRAIHYPKCRKQECSSRNLCQCQTVWHHCLVHRTDPVVHKSRKAPKKTEEEKEAKRKHDESKAAGKQEESKKRPPPVINDDGPISNGKKSNKKTAKAREYALKLISKPPPAEVRPPELMLIRVRERQQQNEEKAAKEKNARSRPDDGQECQGSESKRRKQQERHSGLPDRGQPDEYFDETPGRESGIPDEYSDETPVGLGSQRPEAAEVKVDESNNQRPSGLPDRGQPDEYSDETPGCESGIPDEYSDETPVGLGSQRPEAAAPMHGTLHQDTSEPKPSSPPIKVAEPKPAITRSSFKRALELKVEEQRSKTETVRRRIAEAEADFFSKVTRSCQES